MKELARLGRALPRLSHITLREREPHVRTPPLPHRTFGRLAGRQPISYPFSSSWEVWVDGQLKQRDPRWLPQVPFRGASTRPDWYHPLRRIAIFLDGPVHVFRFKQAGDDYKRMALRSLGVRVVVWAAPSLLVLKHDFNLWYNRDIGN